MVTEIKHHKISHDGKRHHPEKSHHAHEGHLKHDGHMAHEQHKLSHLSGHPKHKLGEHAEHGSKGRVEKAILKEEEFKCQ